MSEWISVEDRLPEPDIEFHGSEFSHDLLIYSEEDGIMLGYYFFPWRNMSMKGFAVRKEGKFNNITHWMPLPEKPND